MCFPPSWDRTVVHVNILIESWSPKFTVIGAQKNHHTKFFPANAPDNVPPGMRQLDLHINYHVLRDEIGFSAEAYDLQELVHSLSYLCGSDGSMMAVIGSMDGGDRIQMGRRRKRRIKRDMGSM
ncbi:hypothetical protein RIF29_17340 [Crotalaria pallida]|uniref:Uncharacterized protein n=1 Tax=Crotalaria pallida TaxID=3830 RepID=A0AAN9IF81_CROPI